MKLSMKSKLIFLFLFLFKFVCAQQVLYVNADNGLIVRSAPQKDSKRLGKLEYGSMVEVLEETEIEIIIQDGPEYITGRWVEISEIDGNLYGYVFDGYLTSDRISKRFEIKFQEFSLFIEMEASDIINSINIDTAKIGLEIGDTPENKSIKIHNFKFKEIKIFQQHVNSLTIMNEGEHCDLTDWISYYSDWEKLDFDSVNQSFKSFSYEVEDWQRFSEVESEELREAVELHCGEFWLNHIGNSPNIHEYPIGVSMNKIIFKVLLTDSNGSVQEKIIEFEIPMGC